MRNWLLSLPCVIDGRVRVDVRGPWPVAILGYRTVQVEDHMDFLDFIIKYLD